MGGSVSPVVARLARPESASWVLSVYPQAREAGGCFVPSTPRRGGQGVRGQAADAERARDEAARRARAKLRRYCATNRLNRLGTLTYRGAGCHDPRQVRADLGVFFPVLRAHLGGGAFPYVWVPEWHPGGHGLHVHFAVGRFIKQSVIKRAWGRGFVSIKQLNDLPVGSGTLDQARLAARYLSKYVTKSFADADRPAGLHRYEVAQGFQPKAVRLTGHSADHVLGQASAGFGAAPVLRWSSADLSDWRGAPAIWAQWA
ncbi:hypothetical protein Pme01_41150 [Planosporangium mesophilum]|uniref:Replication-associated protein ORF2/G2P domain-containing protein n=1 Tax=Planosporangium mesophilum TaxID=689768 RepID=A0A8J3TD19_9ACTN|nr:hypothetical protein Pme01_41150 [Planosporangium mesophilum]